MIPVSAPPIGVLAHLHAILCLPCARLLDGVLEGGRPLQQPDIELLLRCRAADFAAVVGAADRLRRTVCGDTVSYVVNRNINYTNVCTYKWVACGGQAGCGVSGGGDGKVAQRADGALERCGGC